MMASRSGNERYFLHKEWAKLLSRFCDTFVKWRSPAKNLSQSCSPVVLWISAAESMSCDRRDIGKSEGATLAGVRGKTKPSPSHTTISVSAIAQCPGTLEHRTLAVSSDSMLRNDSELNRCNLWIC